MTFISRSNGSSYPFKKIVNHSSYPLKRSSAFRMVWAVPSKNICQPFQLSVEKKTTVTSSFHLENEEWLAFVAFWKLLCSHAVSTSCWLDDTSCASQHTKKSSKHFKVRGIASNIPRNKSALVMGICTTFTCFQTPLLRKHSTIETSLKSICRSRILVISTYKTCMWSLQANTPYFVVLTEPFLQKSM